MDGGAEERQRGCEHDHEVDERETTPEVPSSDSSDGSESEQADEGAPAEECPAAAPSDREEGELEDADDLPDHDDDDPITAQQLHELPTLEREEGLLGRWRLFGSSWRLYALDPSARYNTFLLHSSSADATDPRPKPSEANDENDTSEQASLPLPAFMVKRETEDETPEEAIDNMIHSAPGSIIQKPDAWYFFAAPNDARGPFAHHDLEERMNRQELPAGLCAFRASDKHWNMFGRKAEASSTAYARVAGQLHHAALKTAKRWILDIPIHDIVEDAVKELQSSQQAAESETRVRRSGALSLGAMPVHEQRPMEDLLRQQRPQGLAQRQRMSMQRQSKDRNRRARKKRGFSSEPDANASIKLSRNGAVRRKEDNPADFHTEASRLEFSFNKLPVHLIARCLLALGSDETSAARASATCRAFKMAYGAASDEKDRQAIVRRSRERDYKDAVHKMLERVHKEVRDQDENGFFTQAVSPEEAPDYYKMIETPMDLATMKKRLQGRHYSAEEGGIQQFEHDIRLIFANCRAYNALESKEVAEANRLEQVTKKKLALGRYVLQKRLWESAYTTHEEEDDNFVAQFLADFRQSQRSGARHFSYVDDYVTVETAAKEVEQERTLDYPDEERRARHANKPRSWWPEEESYPQRYSTKTEMREQETFGIDHATARNVVRLLPSELTADEQWNFVENTVMPALNRVYGNLPASDRRTQTLTMAMDNVVMHLMSVSHFDEPVPHETKQLASSAKLIARRAEEEPVSFAVHRKGYGVVCQSARGVKKGAMVVDFLGEVYPPWRWHEKQDGIKAVQRKYYEPRDLPGETTEFYNMQLERPKGDAKGYGLLFIDAMHRTNFSARMAHSCTPNVEVRVKAVDGKYRVHFYALRDILFGEELCYDYNTITDSEDEQRNAFCLCGTRSCRWSFLSLVGADAYSQVWNEEHRLEHRQDILLRCSENELRPEEKDELDEMGFVPGRGALNGLPLWMHHFVATIAAYMRKERVKLYQHLYSTKVSSDVSFDSEVAGNADFDAQVESNSNLDNRLASLSATLSKVRYALRAGAESSNCSRHVSESVMTRLPLRILGEEDLFRLWFGMGSEKSTSGLAWRTLFGCEQLLPVGDATCLREHVTSLSEDMHEDGDGRSVQTRLMELRDEIERLSGEVETDTSAARLHLCADMLHLHACTKLFFVPNDCAPYVEVESEPMPVREDEVTPGVGARGAGSGVLEEYKKQYDKHFVWSQLAHWNEHLESPTEALSAKRAGVLALPQPAQPLEAKTKVTAEGAGKAREAIAQWLEASRQRSWSEEWPLPSGCGTVTADQVHGSPVLDVAHNVQEKEGLSKAVRWLRERVVRHEGQLEEEEGGEG